MWAHGQTCPLKFILKILGVSLKDLWGPSKLMHYVDVYCSAHVNVKSAVIL